MNSSQRGEIAGRIRRLLVSRIDDLPALAEELGVEELSLRLSIDKSEPRPTLDVLVAVVRRYGIDPAYLLSGKYDRQTHSRVLEGDREVTADVLRQFARDNDVAISGDHKITGDFAISREHPTRELRPNA